jgi:hypothetical protein
VKPTFQIQVQARQRELLIMYGRVRSAVQGLVTQNANAMALFEEIRSEFGDRDIEGHFVPVHFAAQASPDVADGWIRYMDGLH